VESYSGLAQEVAKRFNWCGKRAWLCSFFCERFVYTFWFILSSQSSIVAASSTMNVNHQVIMNKHPY
jgi:hypothetical protein